MITLVEPEDLERRGNVGKKKHIEDLLAHSPLWYLIYTNILPKLPQFVLI